MGKKKNKQKQQSSSTVTENTTVPSVSSSSTSVENTSKKIHYAVCMMVKNEKVRLHVTLNSIKGFADSLIMYDTGSTDNTIEIAREFCEKNKIIFRLIEGTFVNFSVSRNVLLDFADTFEDIDYLLLMDTNDELQGSDELKKFCETHYPNKEKTCFLICQEWFSGNYRKYYNIRLLRPRCNWRYKGAVHEYIWSTERTIEQSYIRAPDNIKLYQDRTQDDDKTSKRFEKDKIMLLEELEREPDEPRNTFYLAQTYSCLGEKQNAFDTYLKRTKLVGFWEEVYNSWYLCGELAFELGQEWHISMSYFLKAFEICERVEPLLRITSYYISKHKWKLAHQFVHLACSLEDYPSQCILFVDKHDYDYNRWHLAGIVCYYVNENEEGKAACLKAIAHSDKGIDKYNLKFYEDRLAEAKLKSLKEKRDKKLRRK